jgi:hypothetical protein
MLFQGLDHHIFQLLVLLERRVKNRLFNMRVNLQFGIDLIEEVFALVLIRASPLETAPLPFGDLA